MRWFSKPAFSAMALRGFCFSSGFGDILRVKTKHGSSCAAAGLREGRSEGGGGARRRYGTQRGGVSGGFTHGPGGCHYGAALAYFYCFFMFRLNQVDRRCLSVERRAASVSRRVLRTRRERRARRGSAHRLIRIGQFSVSHWKMNTLTFTILSHSCFRSTYS